MGRKYRQMFICSWVERAIPRNNEIKNSNHKWKDLHSQQHKN